MAGDKCHGPLLANSDRWTEFRVLDVERGTLGPARSESDLGEAREVDGWYVKRQGRLLAIYVHNGRRYYRCGHRLWDVEDATVRRRVVWPLHSLTFRDGTNLIGRCAWLDLALGRRWATSEPLDRRPGWLPDDDSDWGLFVEWVVSSEKTPPWTARD